MQATALITKATLFRKVERGNEITSSKTTDTSQSKLYSRGYGIIEFQRHTNEDKRLRLS